MAALRSISRRVASTRMPQVFALLALNLFQRPFTLHFLYYVYIVAIFECEWRKYAAARTPATASSRAVRSDIVGVLR
jgi:hypothetical protein